MERIALLQKLPKRMPDPCDRISHQEVGIQKNGGGLSTGESRELLRRPDDLDRIWKSALAAAK